MHLKVQEIQTSVYGRSLRAGTAMIACMTAVLECGSLIATSAIDLRSLLIVYLMTVGWVIMHKLLSVMILYH